MVLCGDLRRQSAMGGETIITFECSVNLGSHCCALLFLSPEVRETEPKQVAYSPATPLSKIWLSHMLWTPE